MFVDLLRLSEPRTNEALEYLYKAIGDGGHTDADIWAPHPDPYVRRIVELFSERGLARFDALRGELLAWLSGARHTHAGTTMPKPDAPMGRWTPEQISLVRLYLETLPPGHWTLDDYQLSVDFLVQRYLPPDDMRTEAEWLATRATLMGRVKANMTELSERQIDQVFGALPLTAGAAVQIVRAAPAFEFMLNFAVNRCAENVRMVTEDVRHAMRGVVARHVEQRALRIPGVPGQSLESELLERFAILNRDWRRIAVTEAGEAAAQGYVASVVPGTRLRRIEQYRGRCQFCASIDGRTFDVVAPDAPDKDGNTQVWLGKTNIGRSAAPRKRVGDLLVQREPHELWWVAAGVQHPHCRGSWLPVLESRPGDDPEFSAWLRTHLASKPEPVHA